MRTGSVVLLVVVAAGISCGGAPVGPPVLPPVDVKAVEAPVAKAEPVPVAATPPPATNESGPAVDFTSFAEMKAAMKGAIGKKARLRVYRDHYTSGKDFTAETCEGRGSMRLQYSPEHRDFVRAMYKTPKNDCAFVTFEITGVDDRIAFFEGKTITIFGIEPRAAIVPTGADFAFIDDVVIAGDDAKGKIVDGAFWAYNGDPTMLWVHDCSRTDAMVFVPAKTAAEKALAKKLSNDPRKCGRAHLRIVDPKFFVGANDGGLQRPRAEVVSVP